MKNTGEFLFVGFISIFLLASCSGINRAEATVTAPTVVKNEEAAGTLVFPLKGIVSEVLLAKNYVYVQLQTDKEKLWTAAPRFGVKVGDNLILPSAGLPMENYNSKLLDRTFEFVYFVNSLLTEEDFKDWAKAESVSTESENINSADTDLSTNGTHQQVVKQKTTITELYAQKEKFDGQIVTLQSVVVKYTPRIMGKNWIHLQDDTAGKDQNNDLTITTMAEVSVGDVVRVQGRVVLNKDFGAGYQFDIIIEDADVIMLPGNSESL